MAPQPEPPEHYPEMHQVRRNLYAVCTLLGGVSKSIEVARRLSELADCSDPQTAEVLRCLAEEFTPEEKLIRLLENFTAPEPIFSNERK